MIVPCRFTETDHPPLANGKRIVRCSRCGFTTKPTGSKLANVRNECSAWPDADEWGYWLALVIASLGMHQERWNWIRRKLGFVKPCKCGERIAELNESGGWLRDRLDMAHELWRRITSAGES